MKIKRALLSVSDKTNLIPLAKHLTSFDVEIISTGGTAKKLLENDIPVTPIESVTKNPEAFDGRMKTISFQIESALLYRRDNPEHVKQAKELDIRPIDLVVCNLYPFAEVSKQTTDEFELIENIDIGGPTMIRAAAKNFDSILTLVDPSDYQVFINETKGALTTERTFRKKMAKKVFDHTYQYDQMIFHTLFKGEENELRYGENPHQSAALYPIKNMDLAPHFTPLQGKKLSYNNILDLDQSWKAASDAYNALDQKYVACSIIKHANPCGLALDQNPLAALKEAWAADPISAFGSIITFSHSIDLDVAEFLSDKFVEIIIAPDFTKKALEAFAQKKNLRLLKRPAREKSAQETVYKSVAGAILVQDEDIHFDTEFNSVTKNPYTQNELARFGVMACKNLKSNAIALVAQTESGMSLVAAGMGQPNRLEALELLAIPRLSRRDINISNCVLISDAFFPFRDSIDKANEFGIKNIIQPGGSIRDKEVIEACNEYGIAMATTGTRHFRH